MPFCEQLAFWIYDVIIVADASRPRQRGGGYIRCWFGAKRLTTSGSSGLRPKSLRLSSGLRPKSLRLSGLRRLSAAR